jgi:hypothetical protein
VIVAVAIGVALMFASPTAGADLLQARPRNIGTFGDALLRPSRWIVGVTVDRAANPRRLDDEDPYDDQLFGLSATYHRGWLGLHGKLLFTPQHRVRRSRDAMVLGTRIAYSAFGYRWSYGVNVQGEAIVDEHQWVLYLSPIELGGDLYVNGSFRVQLFVGARWAAKGALIKNMFIDPNGFEEQFFQRALDERLDSPWEGYVSLVFGRTLD